MLRVVPDMGCGQRGRGPRHRETDPLRDGEPHGPVEVLASRSSIHAKDGRFPNRSQELRPETPWARGKSTFLVSSAGCGSAATGERSRSSGSPGRTAGEHVRRAKRYLERTLRELSGRSK